MDTDHGSGICYGGPVRVQVDRERWSVCAGHETRDKVVVLGRNGVEGPPTIGHGANHE